MEIIPFNRDHLLILDGYSVPDDLEGIEEIERSDNSYTIIHGNRVVFCGGVATVDVGRGLAWSVLSPNIGGYGLLAVTKFAKRLFNFVNHRRIEMDVDSDFEQGHRWARMLGFDLECERRKSYTKQGKDAALYAMVK